MRGGCKEGSSRGTTQLLLQGRLRNVLSAGHVAPCPVGEEAGGCWVDAQKSTTCDFLVRGAGRPGLVLLGDYQQGAERAGAAGLASPTPRPGDCARLRPRPSHGLFRGVTAAYVFCFFFYIGLFMPRTKSPPACRVVLPSGFLPLCFPLTFLTWLRPHPFPPSTSSPPWIIHT